ncbi:flagellar hook-length control protein FliK [Ramlibacter sp. H39-3-26]|uniref:flagellar hook-length control protein FliK n=1 Tax=Curvibacter soli TaxID=3031331 RepID=UPI0023DAD017|nr:flagellar hook-length control protein FliK [Ramlibacter sp. H39-3-26]MDF1484229.1 flagellar hook-length control protein FliK [Ramlibacter sp. H39-3-26]
MGLEPSQSAARAVAAYARALLPSELPQAQRPAVGETLRLQFAEALGNTLRADTAQGLSLWLSGAGAWGRSLSSGDVLLVRVLSAEPRMEVEILSQAPGNTRDGAGGRSADGREHEPPAMRWDQAAMQSLARRQAPDTAMLAATWQALLRKLGYALRNSLAGGAAPSDAPAMGQRGPVFPSLQALVGARAGGAAALLLPGAGAALPTGAGAAMVALPGANAAAGPAQGARAGAGALALTAPDEGGLAVLPPPAGRAGAAMPAQGADAVAVLPGRTEPPPASAAPLPGMRAAAAAVPLEWMAVAPGVEQPASAPSAFASPWTVPVLAWGGLPLMLRVVDVLADEAPPPGGGDAQQRLRQRRRRTVLHIELELPQLGRVAIQVHAPAAGAIALQLDVEDEAALPLLRQSLSFLIAALARAGLRLVRCRFSASRAQAGWVAAAAAAHMVFAPRWEDAMAITSDVFRAAAEVVTLLSLHWPAPAAAAR